MKKEIYEIQEELYKNKISNNDIGWSNQLHLDFKMGILDSLYSNQKFKNVLVLGCGDGQVLYQLAMNNKETQFVGVDISEVATDWAKKRCEGMNNVKVFRADIIDWVNEGLYDLVIDDYVLHCMVDNYRDIFINKVKGWLASSGDFCSFTIVKDKDAIKDTYQIIKDTKIRQFLTIEELNDWFVQKNFNVIKSEFHKIEGQPIQLSILSKSQSDEKSIIP